MHVSMCKNLHVEWPLVPGTLAITRYVLSITELYPRWKEEAGTQARAITQNSSQSL